MDLDSQSPLDYLKESIRRNRKFKKEKQLFRVIEKNA